MIGKTLFHYKVLEKIRQGRMEEVYRAEDSSLKREVAIKVLPKFANGTLSITLILFLTAVGLAQGSWTSIGPDGGPSSFLVIDPANPMTLYAGTTSDGVSKSTNGGANWSAANNGLPQFSVNALAINPANPMTLYAGTNGGGVFKSTNGGASWSAANNGFVNTSILTLAIDPANPMTLYAGGGGVFKSTNGGATGVPPTAA